MAPLREDFPKHLDACVSALRVAVDAGERRPILDRLHCLCAMGLLGPSGFAEELHRLSGDWSGLQDIDWASLFGMLEGVNGTEDTESLGAHGGNVTSPDGGVVFVIERDPAEADTLADQLRQFGYPVHVFVRIEGAMEAIGKGVNPAAVVVGEVGGDLLGLAETKLPVIGLGSRSDVELRRTLALLGFDFVANGPTDVHGLVDRIDFLLGIRKPNAFRALLVDSDAYAGRGIQAALERAGMEVRRVQTAIEAVDAFALYKPDVLVVDRRVLLGHDPDSEDKRAEMLSGQELVRLVRQDDSTLGISAVVLTAVRMMAPAQELGEAVRTLSPCDPVMVDAIREEARRTRLIGQATVNEEVTGILQSARFQEEMEHEVARCVRHGLVVAMAVVEVDGLPGIHEEHGRAAGGKVMAAMNQIFRQRLRRTDVIGRVGADGIGVLMPHTTSMQAAKVVIQVQTQLNAMRFASATGIEFRVTMSGGISTCPVHVQPSQLSKAAERARKVAKGRGLNQVVREEELIRYSQD